MRFVTYRANGQASYGLLRGTDIVDLASRLGAQAPTLRALIETGRAAELVAPHAQAAADHQLGQVELLPVIPDPSLIACIGHNYEAHRIETGREVVGNPSVFLRIPDSLQGADQPLLMPRESDRFDYEGELAIVIGKGGRRIPEAEAWDHVFGVSCFNDGSVRDYQRHTAQFIPGKNFPLTGSFGPALVTLDELPADRVVELTTRLNGEVMQNARTDQLIFPIPRLIAYISTWATLRPGDVIVTGTPGGVGDKRNPQRFMKDGEVVEVEISSVGLLRNVVKKEA
ncbi:fumarylacetoacetate hydrolase family protein [Caldimonas thermodepolymerans]|uniref:2-keto-4-pentenoate hydratase/2-oxohepta-3-ene-1,7-dioic acid hydratase in catechol pathway n=1 Tax=Caldimonas thermodepolymerans TaxID=215580 RepID=A0AA46DFH2_9BURK|nr:fumarylacetoacetate hydrolase family protein [Caldimonas thermodepolymerans]TCP07749.1 2-keto-4-pentenoate hydratase/2-oxohepta-3-ene-1,7-dioic acid hydratase in catechol pathway [Caldimonas thermodepolymerans]UZG44248.1 fumarylacetoacetate hydrolase family protein [Caldimonas thermodepolymerans]UZG47914.1 fumarylacetoacetate hydrolase family protein [Caldimonas thermodepolymerans]